MSRRLTSYVSLLISVILFLAISLHQLDLPGLYYDEGFDLTPMLSVMHSEPAELLRGVGISLFGHTYPVMRMDYMGSLNGYLTLPFMAALGPGYLAARLEPLVFSLITVVLAWVLVRRWFGDQVAALTALLLSVNPSFIWFTRQGITVTSVMTVFALGSWIVLDVWRVRIRDDGRPTTDDGSAVVRRPSSVVFLPLLAGLLLGLGLWAKIVFVWWLVLTGVVGGVWLLGQWRLRSRDDGRPTTDSPSSVVRRPSSSQSYSCSSASCSEPRHLFTTTWPAWLRGSRRPPSTCFFGRCSTQPNMPSATAISGPIWTSAFKTSRSF